MQTSQSSTSLPETGFVRSHQLVPAILPVSIRTLQRMVQRGDFPKPVRLTEGVSAWRVEDVRAWMASRV